MRNSYRIIGEVVLLKLNRQSEEEEDICAIVSVDDLPKLLSSNITWSELRTEYGSYVVGYVAGSGRGSTKVRLHRFITDCPSDLVVDHINGNGLDNRRENLRVCTQLENMQNITKQGSGNYSKVRGVSFYKRSGKWTACFYSMKTRHHVGYFDTEQEAIDALSKSRAKHREEITNGY